MIAMRKLTREAIEQYAHDYCTGNESPFSHDDFSIVVSWLMSDNLCDYRTIHKFLQNYKINIFDIIPGNSNLSIRHSKNTLEILGITLAIYNFIRKFDDSWTLEEIDNNLSAERDMGRFNLFDDIILYDCNDIYAISHFQLTTNSLYASIRNKTTDKIVAYVNIV